MAIRPYYFAAHYNLSTAFLEKGEADAAIFHCTAALSIQPEHADAHTNIATALLEKGQVADAIVHYKKALEIAPRSVTAQNNLAWILATSSNPSLRNGTKALELARQANQLSGGGNSVVLHSLAAAYAEVGQFAKAVEVAQDALRLAVEQGNSTLGAALQEEIALYQADSPYRETTK